MYRLQMRSSGPLVGAAAALALIVTASTASTASGGGRYPPLNEDGELLIIAHDAWIENVQPLADHKIATGINTTIVGVSTIGNTAAAIKDYIQNAYNTGNLSFVLLVGDAEHVATPIVMGTAADPTYALLAGGDRYPDIMVGRFSAQMELHVNTQVQRTIDYELAPAPLTEWFKRGCGIGGGTATQHLDNIRDNLLAHGYTHVDQLYEPDVTAALIAAAINDGRGIINYAGLGGSDLWGTGGFTIAHVNALANQDMLPFIVNVASLNGAFNGRTCLAEAWLRANAGGVPTGAIAAYMASTHQYWDAPLVAQEEFVNLFLAGTYERFGTLCFAASCRMIDQYGSIGADTFDHWIVFGDPSLRVVVPPPCPADVNGDGTVDVLDLLAVLAAWGATGGPEDINGDGIVNVLDLLEVLAAWGPCP